MPGPIPKRSDQRVRRNKVAPIDRLPVIGRVPQPDLGVEVGFEAEQLWLSMPRSGQSLYYEASDYAYARFGIMALDAFVRGSCRGAAHLTAIRQYLTPLMLTEGDRRQGRLELDRNDSVGAVGPSASDYIKEILERREA